MAATGLLLWGGTALAAAGEAHNARDLLPEFAVAQNALPQEAALEGHALCGGAGGNACRMVAQASHRRRALVLRPGATSTLELEARKGDEIRLEMTRLKFRAPHLVVKATLLHPDGETSASVSTHPATRGWRPLRLPVEYDGRQTLELSVSQPPKAVARAGVAIASPRLLESASEAASPRPNILLYLMDTLRADHTSPHGYARNTTPRLGQLATTGTVFTDASSTAPVTRPSTASLLTSRFPSETRARLDRGLDREVGTLAEALKAQGYLTWAFVANGNVFEPAWRFDQGFDRFDTIRGVNLDNHAHSDEINERILPHLDRHPDEPFFLYVHAVDPHSPYDPPPSHRNKFTAKDYAGPIRPEKTLHREFLRTEINEDDLAYIVGLYDEDILYQDASFGRLLDALAERGRLENTLVVVVSDHGDEFREHGNWEHGSRLYEHQTRVPFIVAGPGVKRARVEEPVSLVDVMPTVLGHIGAPPAPAARGRDLSGVLRGTGTVPDVAIYSEEMAKRGEWNALRQDGWKIIRKAPRQGEDSDEERAEYLLFNLKLDPGEQEDRAKAEPERLATMREALLTLRAELRKASTAGDAPTAPIDPRTRRQLEALGYLVD